MIILKLLIHIILKTTGKFLYFTGYLTIPTYIGIVFLILGIYLKNLKMIKSEF